MPSAFALRLNVKVLPGKQVPACSPLSGGTLVRCSTDEQHQAETGAEKPRTLLLRIEEPEKVSLGNLANLIKDHYRELWPTEEPLQIDRLINDAYPDAAFSVNYSVADVWVDNGRREREGFDQWGIVRVIQDSSSSTPAHRFQRDSSVFQDIEGAAAREAKRKSRDDERSANGSSASRTVFQDNRQTDLPHRQPKRPRLTENTDPQSPSPVATPEITTSPLYYNDRPVPSFAHPRGHRRHLSHNSTGSSPEKGLGLGITASPVKPKAPSTKVTADGSPGPKSIPPPRRRSLRGRTNSSPPRSFSHDASPLGSQNPESRNPSSVPRETSRETSIRKIARTRSSQKTPGSGKRSHRATPSTGPGGVSNPMINAYWEKRDRNELQEIRKLLRSSNTNPDCLPLLREMCKLHEEKLELHAGSYPNSQERRRLIGMKRRTLLRRRKDLNKLKSDGKLYKETEAQITSSEDEDTGKGADEESNESSEEDIPTKAPKRSWIEQRDLSADLAAARRILSLRGHSKRVESGDRLHKGNSRESDGRGIQVVIEDTGSEQISLPVRNPAAQNSQSSGVLCGGATSDDETEDKMTDSDGDDIEFDTPGIKVEPSSPMHDSNAVQKASSPIARTAEAGLAEEANGADRVDATARNPVASEKTPAVSTIEHHNQQQHPEFPTLRHFIQDMPKEEALAYLSPYSAQKLRLVASSVTSEDETSEHDSSEADGDHRMRGNNN